MDERLIHKSIKLIKKFIEKEKIKFVLIALSGGQDSIALVKLLEKVRKYYRQKIKVSYIHIDHQWKKNSYVQTEQIINYISSLRSELIIYQIKSRIKSEDNCRIQRYHTIIQHALKYNYQLIITGHHNTDKIETFFQNIYRGCGIEGINSLVNKNELYHNIFMLRPLLDSDKDKIHWLCKKMNLPIWSDSTNYIYSIKRNRIRYELMPYFNNFYNKQIRHNISYFTKLYNYENEYIKQNCIKLYLRIKHKSRIAINYKILTKNHFIMQTRIIQLFIFHSFRLSTSSDRILKIVRKINQNSTDEKIIAKHEQVNYFIRNEWIYIKLKN